MSTSTTTLAFFHRTARRGVVFVPPLATVAILDNNNPFLIPRVMCTPLPLLCPHSHVTTNKNSEIERLELMIAETKNSIEKYKGQGVSTDTQRKKVLRGLEEQLSVTEVSRRKKPRDEVYVVGCGGDVLPSIPS